MMFVGWPNHLSKCLSVPLSLSRTLCCTFFFPKDLYRKKQNGDLDLQPFLRQGPSHRGLISPRWVALDALLCYFCFLPVSLFPLSARVSTFPRIGILMLCFRICTAYQDTRSRRLATFSLRTSLAYPGWLLTRSGPSLGRRGPPQTCSHGPTAPYIILQASGA